MHTFGQRYVGKKGQQNDGGYLTAIFVFLILFLCVCIFYNEHTLFTESENNYFCYGERYICLKECVQYIIIQRIYGFGSMVDLAWVTLPLETVRNGAQAKSKGRLSAMGSLSAYGVEVELCLLSTVERISFKSLSYNF